MTPIAPINVPHSLPSRATMRTLACTALAVVSALTASHAQKAQAGLRLGATLSGSYNQMGVLLDTRALYRIPLSSKPGVLWQNTRIDVGIHNELTPTDDLLAARVTVEPIGFLELNARVGFYGMHTALGFGFRSLAGPNATYDSDALEQIPGKTRTGAWINGGPTLKLKFKSIVVIDALNITWINLGDSGYFLDMRCYQIRRTRDTDITNDAFVLYQIRPNLMAGVTYRALRMIGTDHDSHRLALVGAFTPSAPGRNWRVAVMIGGYPRDRLFGHNFYCGGQVGYDVQPALRHKGTQSQFQQRSDRDDHQVRKLPHVE